MFGTNLAYRLLTECKFVAPEVELLPKVQSLQDDHIQIDDISSLPNTMPFIIELPSNINLTEKHQQALTNEIKSVYSEVDVVYHMSKNAESLKHLEQSINTRNGVGESYYKKSQKQDRETYLEELDQTSNWYKIRQKLKNHFGYDIDKA